MKETEQRNYIVKKSAITACGKKGSFSSCIVRQVKVDQVLQVGRLRPQLINSACGQFGTRVPKGLQLRCYF